MQGNSTKGHLYATAAAISWGSVFISCKLVYQSDIGPFFLLFLRYLIATIVCIAFYRNRPRPKLVVAEKKNIITIGFIGYFLNSAFCLVGNEYISASMGAIINTITPIGIIAFDTVLLKEKPSPQKKIGIIVSTIGAIIIIGFAGGGSTLLGIALNLVCVILWSLTSVLIRKYSSQIDTIWLTIYAVLVAMFINIPFVGWEIVKNGLDPGTITPMVIIGAGSLGVIGTACANIWWSKALEVLPAATCSMFYALMPVATAILEILVLREIMTAKFIAGSLIIIMGILIALMSDKKTEKECKNEKKYGSKLSKR